MNWFVKWGVEYYCGYEYEHPTWGNFSLAKEYNKTEAEGIRHSYHTDFHDAIELVYMSDEEIILRKIMEG